MGSLELHFTVDHRKLFCACDICGYAFHDEARLKQHTKIVHEKVHDYICEVCSVTFGRKSQLRRHLANMHEIGEKNFLCDQCPKAFQTASTLSRHVSSVHDKIKNFLC